MVVKVFKALLSVCLVMLIVGTAGGRLSLAVMVKPSETAKTYTIGTTVQDGKEYYIKKRISTHYYLSRK